VTKLRALAFGDLDAGAWGVAWMPEPAGPASVVVGVGASAAVVSATLAGGEPAEQWRLEGDAVELVLSPLGAPVRSGSSDGGIEGFDQLSTANGRFTLDGEEQPVDCLGWRSARSGNLDLRRLGSFRQVSAWFKPGAGLALLALRSRKSRGQEADVLAAGVLETERPGPVADPRLSTTYTAAGLPIRAGLELWVESGPSAAGEAEPDDPAGEADEHVDSLSEPAPDEYPRRAAGEALGVHADWSVAEFELHAELFRWHNHGHEGAGVYLLGQQR
jgi:hypothetical protein